MTLIIVGILLLGFMLIATESLTNVNKAAVAIFACTVGWVLYIGYGTDFVMSQHAAEYLAYLDGEPATSIRVKEFIAGNVFLKYVGRASEIVLFLLATRTIVEVLDSNGCFDFITQLLRTRSSRRLLWMLATLTLFISAHLDNLTTTVMMLVIMRSMVRSRRQRMIYGSVIVLAANCGGAMTVIGSPTGLMLWNGGHVTASPLFLTLALPCLLAWALPTWWIGRQLPERVETEWTAMRFRGDDTRLAAWQRVLMIVVGIGGLWFIPTFHSITKLSPFIGALCVVSVLWVVNEVMNRKLMDMDSMSERRIPNALYYGSHQLILFVLGITLALGVVHETGALQVAWQWLDARGVSAWMLGGAAGMVSVVLDNFATASAFISLHPATAANDPYWMMVAYMSAVGGNVLLVGSMAGLALIQTEKIHAGWYFAHVGWKALVAAVAGFGLLVVLLYAGTVA